MLNPNKLDTEYSVHVSKIKECEKSALSSPTSKLSVEMVDKIVFYIQKQLTVDVYNIVASKVFIVKDTPQAAVMLSYYKDADNNDVYDYRCGDRFIHARLTPGTSEDDVLQANKKNCETVLKQHGITDKKLLSIKQKEIMSNFGMFKDSVKYDTISKNCSFYRDRRNGDIGCRHTTEVIQHIGTKLEAMKKELKQAYENFDNIEGSTKYEAVLDYAFKAPILLEGPAGTGKTFIARTFAKNDKVVDYSVEIQGHEDVESSSLLGYLRPVYVNGSQQYSWVDGPLSQAYRKASKGEKVCIIFDEMLRVPMRHLSPLMSALVPTPDGLLRLCTERVVGIDKDGIGITEMLEAPAENICVIATTNSGIGYAVDEIDPALRSRFMVVYVPTDLEQLTLILKNVSKANNVDVSIATKLLDFYKMMNEALNRSLIQLTPNTRDLVRALTLSDKTMLGTKKVLWDQRFQWVGRDADGSPIVAHETAIETILAKLF